jgi:ribosomal protein S25
VLKRSKETAHNAHSHLEKFAISNANKMASILGVSVPTARLALNNLKELDIVTEISGSSKERLYIYTDLINILEQGTEPIPL